MKQRFHFFATCPRGLEAVLSDELQQLGAEEVAATDGGVAFRGDWALMMTANLHSRIASRILWSLLEKPYRSEDDIYRAARALDWPELFSVERTIKVAVTGIGCKLRSLDFVALKVKDAICDAFRAAVDARPSVDTVAPDMRIHVFLTEKMLTLYLDTSGDALFKRGYRRETGEAPLRENLAAGILRLTGWQPGEPLLDPMCGSGTFLIEAALIARGIAPGGKRSFAFERYPQFDADAWARVKEAALAKERPVESISIYGSDDNAAMLSICRTNLAAAGVADCVELSRADALERSAPAEQGVLVCNPPYGIRLEEQESLAVLYPLLGHALKQRFAGWRAYYFTGDLRLAKLIRLAASKRTVLFNGGLECRLFEYRMVAGSNRKPA
ncbi:THUMP domain-containing class I SAM-dependent RNA methyltransferase [Chitinimonas koreensis]|uniref:THUMP domain-containing class I SAM-dependent RNA methyltransferase n=1 Tax=Chitinimonas koreensis TaxID=356302 RepID=UPI0004167DBB|nr:THUMP domain-containing protein [Chitinimonas koreensis]QNM96468.1 N-6 DNA methylase [Chitinimonas koreensis]